MKQASNIFGASHNCLSPPSDNSMAFSGKPQMAAGTVQFSGAKFHMESPSQMHWSNATMYSLTAPLFANMQNVLMYLMCKIWPGVPSVRPGVCKMCKRCKMCSTMAGPPSTTGSGLTSWLLSPIKSALQQICSFQWGRHWRAPCTWHCRKWGQPSKPPHLQLQLLPVSRTAPTLPLQLDIYTGPLDCIFALPSTTAKYHPRSERIYLCIEKRSALHFWADVYCVFRER